MAESSESSAAPSMQTSCILVVDDEYHQRTMLTEAIRDLGYSPKMSPSPIQALELLEQEHFDVVVTDLQMPEMSGIEFMHKVRQKYPSISIVVVTAHGTIETAVEAIKGGAEDYLEKPIEFAALEVVLKRVYEKKALIQQNTKLRFENESLKQDIGIKFHLITSIGVSKTAKDLLKNIEAASASRKPLLLVGEPGTAKEDIAKMIHYNSAAKSFPVLLFNAQDIPEDLHELHLFGEEHEVINSIHIPGHPGLVEKAHRGTLIIENVQFLRRKVQAQLSQIVQTKHSQRQAQNKQSQFEQYYTDFRLIATVTPGDLDRIQVDRWELYDALSENQLRIPPLKERKDDIPLLALALTKKLAVQYGKSIEKMDKELIDHLKTREFSGNFQELESLIEFAVIRCSSNHLSVNDFTG